MQPERLNRRDFVRAVGLSAAGMAVERALSANPVREGRAINLPREPGIYYEATVPDTLDLAERARLGINHFTSIISEKDDYEMYSNVHFEESSPPAMQFTGPSLFTCQAKCMEAMAMERIMCGSQQLLDREAKMVEMLASYLGDDGLFYVVPSGGRKPWQGPEEYRPYAHVNGQVRMMRAMITWYQYTGDPAWKERLDRMVDGLDRLMVVHKDDYAYFPAHGLMEEEYLRSCYVRGRGYKDAAEPENEKAGEESSLFVHQGEMPGPLANWYMLTGNKQALRLAGELVRFLTKPKFWADWEGGEYPGVVGAEHAHWRGHYHGYMYVLRAILEYALAAKDARLEQFVRDGYEWTRQAGLTRIGVVADAQGCGCGRLIGLAIKLTDAGVGDYWEDVDLYIRNHGIEMQLTPEDIPYLRKLGEGKPAPKLVWPIGTVLKGEKVLEASMGAFSENSLKVHWALCCSPWGNMGLFYAWDGTLRCADGVARVNLLLNRASPWMDIDSSLPYEGKVILRNKSAREVFVRIPLSVDTKTVQCGIGDRRARFRWFGRYMWFEDLRAGDVVTIEFPIEERTERWTAPPKYYYNSYPLSSGTVYTLRFRGNTLVELSPPLMPGSWLYQDRPEKYKAPRAPLKNVTRYVTNLRLRW